MPTVVYVCMHVLNKVQLLFNPEVFTFNETPEARNVSKYDRINTL
jgi:hypothetical protein